MDAEELRHQRLVRELSRDVGRFLLDAARAHPPPWSEPETEDGAGADAPPTKKRPRRRDRRQRGL